MQIDLSGGTTSALGFSAALLTCGIKLSGRPDLALLVSDAPCDWAAAFTTNAFAAAPVQAGRRRLLAGGPLRGVLVNSGNANACTGAKGLMDAEEMASRLAEELHEPSESVLPVSTGVIGVPLPMEKIRTGIRQIASLPTRDGGLQFAEGILTTDTRPKSACVRVAQSTGTITIGGCCKGAGMIHPRLATMLAFITTDAAIETSFLRAAFARSVEATFNRISVDGDTSTNDTAILMASGAAGLSSIQAGTADAEAFEQGLLLLLGHLAREIVRDGEGATLVACIEVCDASSPADAEKAARAIALSSLVRTALHGRDPNWGRILSSVGASGICIDPARVEVDLQGTPVLRAGAPLPFDEKILSASMDAPEVSIKVSLGTGGGASDVFWTCDLGAEYVRINANYRT